MQDQMEASGLGCDVIGVGLCSCVCLLSRIEEIGFWET